MITERLRSEETWDLTKSMLLRHSVTRPPYSVAVFSANDLKVIMDYVLNTFFRHFNLYQYVYVPHRQLKLRGKTSTFLPPIPFAIAMALERRCEKKLAEFDAIIKQQDQKFEAEVRAT